MPLNKSHYNIKSNNDFESIDNFESSTKSLDIISQRTVAVLYRQRKYKDSLNNVSACCQN